MMAPAVALASSRVTLESSIPQESSSYVSLKNNKKADCGLNDIQSASTNELFRTATLLVEKRVAGSNILDAHNEDRIPRFERSELRLGRTLGRGGFCIVTEIEKFKIFGTKNRGSSIGSNAFGATFFRGNSESVLDDSVSNADSESFPIAAADSKISASARSVVSAPASRMSVAQIAKNKNHKGGLFALKQVLPDMKRSNKVNYLKGIVDLSMEAKFLSSLDHPNIIGLCGFSKNGPGDFIIVERLRGTLSGRFKDWMKIDRQCKGVTGIFTGSKRKVTALYESRISVAHDIASAVNYLHSHDIIFRDLKPDNIGFDAFGVVKIFDFGLAKELRDCDRNEDGLYNLTGMTGAIRYMAPEVGLGKAYNLTADVYSWSMIMWFILALEPPFGLYTEDMIRDRVFKRGSRPSIFDSWSDPLGDAMKRAWNVDISIRPSIAEVCAVLRRELVESDGTATSSSHSSGTNNP